MPSASTTPLQLVIHLTQISDALCKLQTLHPIPRFIYFRVQGSRRRFVRARALAIAFFAARCQRQSGRLLTIVGVSTSASLATWACPPAQASLRGRVHQRTPRYVGVRRTDDRHRRGQVPHPLS